MVPKARVSAAFNEADEDEKTTIESAWGDEASTTVEQGEVAEKIRALGTDQPARERGVITSVTSTNHLEEPTVDDQRAHAALSVITPPTLQPLPDIAARLVCTQGNDTGQQIEIRPGKSYSIGRAIDNDFVLTDIAVSRKHFDLRHENGAWVLADRGSGNGTVVNGTIEDAPFLLAHGDTIEIGNTSFRFDIPDGGGAVRARGSLLEVDSAEVDEEEEPSTVAGRPMREEIAAAAPAYVPPMRPKTLPPPTPVRARTNSVPPAAYSVPAVGTPSAVPMQASRDPYASGPSPAIQSPPPLAPPPMPYDNGMQPLMQPQSTLPLPQMANRPPPPLNPTMLADAQYVPEQPPPGFQPTTLPGQAPMPRPMYMHGYPQQMPGELPPHLIPPGMPAREPVQSYNGRPQVDPTALVPPTPYAQPAVASYAAQPEPGLISRRAKLVLGGAGLTLLAAAATIAIIKHTESDPDPTPTDPPAVVETKKPKFEPIKPDPPKVTTIETTKKDPPKQDNTKQPDPPKQEVTKQPDPPKQEVKQPDPPKQEVTKQPDPPKQEVKQPDPPKQQVKQPDPPKQQIKQQPDPPKQPDKTAQKSTVDVNQVKQRADEQYRNRQFAQAAATLRNALPQLSDKDQAGLRTIAREYETIGGALQAANGDARTAYSALSTAIAYDRAVGGAFQAELGAKLGQVAPKAAVAFLSKGQYEAAFLAVKTAEGSGNNNDTTNTVRRSLERKATEIYNAAAKDMDTNKDKAKAQLKRIKNMVDPGSAIVAKAQQLLDS